jgi:hypothetical protein
LFADHKGGVVSQAMNGRAASGNGDRDTRPFLILECAYYCRIQSNRSTFVLIPVAELSKARACGRSLAAGRAVSNPAQGMDVCLL